MPSPRLPAAPLGPLDPCRRHVPARVLKIFQACRKDTYCAVATEHLAALNAAFGDDAPRYFKPRISLELTPAATEDKELLAKLIAALGPEKFAQAFIVKQFAAKIGVSKLAPHDLLRSCARLCRAAGGELEQIQILLGHVSMQTTERYLGCTQRISSAVNDRIGIEPNPEWLTLEGLPTISPLDCH